MTKRIKKLYKEALNNKKFNEDFERSDPEYSKPNVFSNDVFKHLYSLVYMGWLIAKDEFIDSNY